jgi:hypothetical protein
MTKFIYLALDDTANRLSFYKLEEWQIETFIRLVVDEPSDGFQWLFENCSENWLPSIKGQPDCPVFRYAMNTPEMISELIADHEMAFPNTIGEEGEF